MKKNSLLIILFFFFLQLSAQKMIPGYMGKRATIGYTFNISPAFNTILYYPSENYTGPLMKNGLKICYVTGRREISFGIRYLSRKLSGYSFKREFDIVDAPDHERFNLIDYVFSWKRFGKTKFAPLGGYNRWDFWYSNGWIKNGSASYRNYANQLVTISSGRCTASGGGFSYSLGRQRIVDDKWVIDYGISGSLQIMGNTDGRDAYQDYLLYDGATTMSDVPLFNVYLGLGFLAF